MTKINFIDRAISFVSPSMGARRLKARLHMEMLTAYDGASKVKRSLASWATLGQDADAEILPDLETLRDRSQDLSRNNPLASGALKTKLTHVVGTGLRLQSRLDRAVLNLTEDAADALEAQIQREWKLFFNSKNCDIARILTGTGITRQMYHQSKVNGDSFAVLTQKEVPGCAYALRLQVIDAPRVCNEDDALDTDRLAGGIEKDGDGAPKKLHVLKQHPGGLVDVKKKQWEIRPFFGEKTGLPNVIHLYHQTRPGQSRGVPDLAVVIELFKQLGRYTEAEIMAAVISGMFTIFIEQENGSGTPGFNYSNLSGETGQKTSDKNYKMGNGLILELMNGQKVHDSNPGRPNVNFDQFVLAILRQVGVGLEIPYEILIKHFTSSYSAARASLLEFWKYVLTERMWLEDNFLKPVFEVFMWHAVSMGRISAPGFFADPGIRAAYLGADFVGPSKGQINELVEVNAAGKRIAHKITTLEQETAAYNGGSWEQNHVQQVKEKNKQVNDGLILDETAIEKNGAGDAADPPGAGSGKGKK